MPVEIGNGTTASVVLSETVSDGAVGAVEYVLAPATATPLHRHSREDEYLYVVEGQLLCTLGDESSVVAAGHAIALPRGVAHTTRNIGSGSARFLSILTPGGFERYHELATCLRRGPCPIPRDALADLASRFGVDVLAEEVPVSSAGVSHPAHTGEDA